MGRKTKVLHREKNFILFWCNLKGQLLELYKVAVLACTLPNSIQLSYFQIEGVKLKPGDPPPNDIIPPTSLVSILL